MKLKRDCPATDQISHIMAQLDSLNQVINRYIRSPGCFNFFSVLHIFCNSNFKAAQYKNPSNPLVLRRTACFICAQADLFSDKVVSKNAGTIHFMSRGCMVQGLQKGFGGRLVQHFLVFSPYKSTLLLGRYKSLALRKKLCEF